MEDRKQRLIEALEKESARAEDNGWFDVSNSNGGLVNFLTHGIVPEDSEAYDYFIEDPETFYSDYLN